MTFVAFAPLRCCRTFGLSPIVRTLSVAALQPTGNVNGLQIEIYGVKRAAKYSRYPSRRWLVEIPVLEYVRYEGQSVI